MGKKGGEGVMTKLEELKGARTEGGAIVLFQRWDG
ncbi:hypothetical protein ES703_78764 [subsurface metagenome]